LNLKVNSQGEANGERRKVKIGALLRIKQKEQKMQQGKRQQHAHEKHLMKGSLSGHIRPIGNHLLQIAYVPTECLASTGQDGRIPKETRIPYRHHVARFPFAVSR
jgi:hypothetical protein